MKHTFNGSDTLCRICHRDELDHSDNAQCEACPNIGPCELINDMLLCATCYEHDKILAEQDSPIPSNDRETRITQLVNQLAREIPDDRRGYFVGRLTAIVDIERELIASGIENPNYKLAELVENNIKQLKARLVDAHNIIRELQGASVADQKYLNQIVPKLREEEREKFKAYDISYQPSMVSKVTSSVAKPRMSASDKAIESMAKMLGISVEQARKSLEGATKNVLGIKCTCNETPGMCKVHV